MNNRFTLHLLERPLVAALTSRHRRRIIPTRLPPANGAREPVGFPTLVSRLWHKEDLYLSVGSINSLDRPAVRP
jgi:hypothetical protein